MKALKYCRTASFVPMMAFLIVFFVYRTLVTGVTVAEMVSAKYVVGYLVSAIVFATVLLLFQVWNEKKKK